MVSYLTYKLLPQNRQAELLFLHGVYLQLIRKHADFNIELYALNQFYVELYFDKLTEEPLFLNAIESVEELEPYLLLIEIDELFEMK